MTAVDPEGRIRHPLDVFHSTFNPDGTNLAAGMVPAADGLGQVEYLDSSAWGGGGSLPWFNVMDPTYGAVNDATTDDTSAITAAIAAWNSAGRGVLYFPAGAGYKCTSALPTITASGLVLGDGPAGFDGSTGTSMVLQTSATANGFTGSGYRVIFRNIGVHNTAGSTPSAGGGIVWSPSTGLERVDLESVSVSRFYDNVDMQGTSWTIRNSWIFAPVRYGVRIRNTVIPDAGDWSIESTGIYASAQNATSAIRIESSGGGKIVGNKINMGVTGHKFATGIDLAIGAGNATSVLTMVSNSIENVTGDAISLAATSTGYYGLVAISGLQVGLYSNNTGRVLNINAATNGAFGTGGSISVVTIDGVVAETDGTARAAISLTKSDKVSIGQMALNGFNARYTGSSDTNTVDDTAISYATPALVLGSAAAAGSASTVIRSDATIDAFTAAIPLVESGSGSAGTAAKASREDHVHPAAAGGTAAGQLLIADTHSTPLVFADLIQNEAQDDLVYAD